MNLSGSAEITLHPDVTNQASGPDFPAVLLSFGDTVVHGGATYDDSNSEFGGLTLQAFDISTGTPVRTDRKTREMNSLEGSYPNFDDMMAVKLDESRGLITWGDGAFTPHWVMVFQVVDGVITFGAPSILFSGAITPANPVESADGTLGVEGAGGRHSALTIRGGGRGVYFRPFRDYNIPGDLTNWMQRVAGADIATNGLEVASVTWWALEPGSPRDTFRFTLAGAASLGNLTFYMSRMDYVAEGIPDYTLLGMTDWDADTPQMVTKQIPDVGDGAWEGFTRAGDHLVFREGEDWVLQETANFAAPVVRLPAEGASLVTGAFFYTLDQGSDTGEWLATWSEETGETFAAKLRYVQGVVKRTDIAPLDVTPPQESSNFEGMTAIFAGDRVLALIDFELLDPPNPYREFLYVYRMGIQAVTLMPSWVMFAPPG